MSSARLREGAGGSAFGTGIDRKPGRWGPYAPPVLPANAVPQCWQRSSSNGVSFRQFQQRIRGATWPLSRRSRGGELDPLTALATMDHRTPEGGGASRSAAITD